MQWLLASEQEGLPLGHGNERCHVNNRSGVSGGRQLAKPGDFVRLAALF